MCWRTEKMRMRSNAKKIKTKKKKKKEVKEEVRRQYYFFTPLFRPPRLCVAKEERTTHTHTRREKKKNRENLRLPGASSTTNPALWRTQNRINAKNAPNPLTFKNAGKSSNLSFIVLIGFVRSPSYKQRKFPTPPSSFSSPPVAVVAMGFGILTFIFFP